MTLRYKMCLFAVKLFEDHGINVDRAEILSLSILMKILLNKWPHKISFFDISLRWSSDYDKHAASFSPFVKLKLIKGPRQANLVLIAYASSEGSGEPAHPRSLARTSAARSYKQ